MLVGAPSTYVWQRRQTGCHSRRPETSSRSHTKVKANQMRVVAGSRLSVWVPREASRPRPSFRPETGRSRERDGWRGRQAGDEQDPYQFPRICHVNQQQPLVLSIGTQACLPLAPRASTVDDARVAWRGRVLPPCQMGACGRCVLGGFEL